jgi:tetratricopeptide (TPR) repeat protein
MQTAPIRFIGVSSQPESERTRRGRRPARWRTIAVAGSLALVGTLAAACSSSTPDQASNNYVAQGLQAQSVGDTAQAVSLFKLAIAQNQDNKAAHYDLGVIYQQQGDATDAVTEYKKALAIDPKFRPALWNLAIIQTLAAPAEAVALYTELLNINPNDANVNFNLGLLLYTQGEKTQGLTYLNKAISLNPALRSRVPSSISL